MGTSATRPSFVVVAERAMLFPIAFFFGALALRVATGLRTPADVLGALAATAIGVALADLLSGVFHWICDTFFEESTPVLGPLVIATFREHHRDPLAITRHGFVERNAVTGFSALAVVALGLQRSVSVVVAAGALACAIAVLLTNEVHAWAHAAHVPPVVRWLQRRGLVLSPERHAAHHRAGETGFSVTTGWTSDLLDWVLARVGAPRGADRGG